MSEHGRLRRVGAMWKPREGAKSLGSGAITVNGLRQRFVVLKNDRKQPGSKDPDYVLMSSEEPEVDQYASERSASSPAPVAPSRPQPLRAIPATELLEGDDIPF